MRILWLDDEPRRVEAFHDALVFQGHDVVLVQSIEELETRLKVEHGWHVILLDIMLPTGEYSVEDAQGGLDTGLLIAKKLRDELPSLEVVLFTNRVDADWLTEKSDARVLRKSEISPWELGPLLGGDPTSDP